MFRVTPESFDAVDVVVGALEGIRAPNLLIRR